MERPKTEVWDTVEGLPPVAGEVRTATSDLIARMRARKTRAWWYVVGAIAAVVGAVLTQAVYQRTGAYYPFISGFVMVASILGGFGPAVLASWGSLFLSHMLPPTGAMFPDETMEIVRFSANVVLLLIAAVLAGQFRSSRLATFERESRLERAAAGVREILNESSDAIVLTDDALLITYINARAEAMFGYPLADAIGRNVGALITPASLAAFPLQTEFLRSGNTIRTERSAFRADGSVIDIDVSARLLSGGRLLASIRDMSERKREAERQRSERDLLNGILATSVAGIAVVNMDSQIIFANHRAEVLLELKKTDPTAPIYDMPAWRQRSPDGSAWLREMQPFHQVASSGGPVFDVRMAIVWPDGRRRTLSVNGGPLRDADGQLQAVVFALNDITDALAAADALRERDRQLEQVTEAMPGMVYQYVMEADGSERFVFVSRYSVELVGATPEQVLADSSRAWMQIHPDDERETRATVMTSFRTLRPWIHEFRMRDARMPDAWRWLSGRAVAQPGPTPGSVLWNGIFVDITDRKVLEENLRQVQKIESVGRLAGSIAHDFNNLLTVILGQAELLEMDLVPESEHAIGVKQIRAAAESGSALTRQLLGFARKQVMAPQVVDINSLVLRIPPLVGRLLGDSVVLELSLTDSAPRVRVDPSQLDQVLMNLTVNARDAMPGGGRLEIRTRVIHPSTPGRADFPMLPAGPLAEISVRDTGVGMSSEVRDRAFEPFFTTKALGKGTGLGLATSYGIVSQAGGTIVIDSVMGQGTNVRVILPATDAPITVVNSARATEVRAGTETILVVDDDASVRGVTAAALRRQGYRVLESESGDAALQLAAAEPGRIHLLVTDVVMPNMSGPQLAAQLTQLRPDTRVLFVSGYAEGAISQHGVLDEGVALLPKPYDIGELAHRVRTLLEAPA